MSRKPKAIVLDSWAVLAYLEDERPAEKVGNLISDAHDDDMSVLNAGEVWYIVAREASPLDADQTVAQLRHLGIKFVEADWLLVMRQRSTKPKTECLTPTASLPRLRNRRTQFW